MNTAVINIKTHPLVKAKAQAVASELGFSLSALVNAYLRQLIKTKTVTFSVESEEPSKELIQMLKESKADIEAGRVSPGFSNTKDAIAWLDDPKGRYENGDSV